MPPRTSAFLRNLARSWAGRYGMASLFVALALGLEKLLQGFFPYPFLFVFFAAVMASAWFGGTGPGLFAVLLSTIAVDYFFVRPFYSLAINATDGSYFAAFILCALVASWISSSKRKGEEALREARDQLEVRVAERTAELQKSNAELQKTVGQHERAQQALMKTQAELAELSRFLTMAELTASIAHEVNQPLTAVAVYGRACLEWLSASPPNLPEARRAAEIVIQDGTRAGTIINRIRALFKRQPVAQDWLNLNEIIAESVGFMKEEAIRHRITIRTELARDLPEIKGDRVQLEQVVLNLVINAIDALREAKETREVLITSRREGSAEVLVSVEDSGMGVSAEIAGRIFDPFFTTKSHGIGMGLSISRSIVESHGGRLWAESRPLEGAIFRFTIRVGS
ncbi:MAG: ATP-binding protein [Candidatus Acidiferrales bacterium]|jgi:C4-dicarboxylate-specific signal transduction histidine kinase